VAGLSSRWKGRLLWVGGIAVVAFLICAPIAVGKCFPRQPSKPEMTFEMAVMESLAEKPADYPTFERAVMQRRELNEGELWNLRHYNKVSTEEAILLTQGDERRGMEARSPVFWSQGFSAQDVRKRYCIAFEGGGGCWGGGGPRGDFYVYVGENDKVIGWYTSSATWRATVIEMSR